MEEPRLDPLTIGLNVDRKLLYERINARGDRMISDGLLDEVKALLSMGYGPGLKSMQSIGYRQMVDYLEGRASFDDAVKILKRDTRRYAKRQLTWFTSVKGIKWFNPSRGDEISKEISSFLNGFQPQAGPT